MSSRKQTKRPSPKLLPDFSALATISATPVTLDLQALFDTTIGGSATSPIDQFLRNADQLNLMYLRPPSAASPSLTVDPLLARLILLGYVSAFESFVRAVVRGLINIDEVSRKAAGTHAVTFGAALHHSKDLLPEALMEGTSLADRDNLKKTFEKYLGLQVEEDLRGPLVDQFRIVCHLRHCCVHRFGRLGSQNALGMGLIDSPHLLERHILLDVSALTSTAEVLRTFAKALNNALFKRVLTRTAAADRSGKRQLDALQHSEQWTWNLKKDRKRFAQYYELFATQEDSIRSPPLKDVYERFRATFMPRTSRPTTRT